MIRTYTAVLAFTRTLTGVAMVKKNAKKLPHLNGKWNGIGGGIDVGEAPASAAAREFTEETGIRITKDDLVNIEHQRFDVMLPNEHHIYWYAFVLQGEVFLPPYNDVGEELAFAPTAAIVPGDDRFCPNLGYLVPKALTFLATPRLDRPW